MCEETPSLRGEQGAHGWELTQLGIAGAYGADKIQAKELEAVHSRVVLDLVFQHMILVLGGQGGREYLDHLVPAVVEQELEKLAENRSSQDSSTQSSSNNFELVLYRKCQSFDKKKKVDAEQRGAGGESRSKEAAGREQLGLLCTDESHQRAA
ncbi:hypothetical protein L7F22_022964 [Adiantum nelumboides]|nr:hypothetical protein [Adiantum nelumboides]